MRALGWQRRRTGFEARRTAGSEERDQTTAAGEQPGRRKQTAEHARPDQPDGRKPEYNQADRYRAYARGRFNRGYCVICERRTVFIEESGSLREGYRCRSCHW